MIRTADPLHVRRIRGKSAEVRDRPTLFILGDDPRTDDSRLRPPDSGVVQGPGYRLTTRFESQPRRKLQAGIPGDRLCRRWVSLAAEPRSTGDPAGLYAIVARMYSNPTDFNESTNP